MTSKKLLIVISLIIFTTLIFSSCKNNEKKKEQTTNTFVEPRIFSVEEIYNFELLRSDWTKEQMDKANFKKKDNEPNGWTTYCDDNIEYIYYDWFESKTPEVIAVYGEYEGPRGIKIGDKFEDVLYKFPQEKDWKKSTFGEFYGTIYETEQWEPVGNVGIRNEEEKHITLHSKQGGPFYTIYFKNDIVTHYEFRMRNVN
ncbi:hypothetical protein [Abyssisolibacter fermentans]|uniref:hypothetical protein n=1 Tax=Abyssisolibacter fermentans TaxID=1766203 RepID=UPI00082DF455|nr:hypothetical protein [Abyssisolibacter fermentans]